MGNGTPSSTKQKILKSFYSQSKTKISKKSYIFFTAKQKICWYFLYFFHQIEITFFIHSKQKICPTLTPQTNYCTLCQENVFQTKNFCHILKEQIFSQSKNFLHLSKSDQFLIITARKNFSNNEFLVLIEKLISYTSHEKLKLFILDLFWIQLYYFLCYHKISNFFKFCKIRSIIN